MSQKNVIGITGITGSGKTILCEYLNKNYCIDYISADKIGHTILEFQNVKTKIVSLLGEKVIYKDGTLNRKIIRNMIFSDKDLLLKYNTIVHPVLYDEIKKILINSESHLIIIEAAILFIIGLNKLCNNIFLLKRDVDINDKNRMVIDIQRKSIEENINKINYIIDNNSNKQKLFTKVNDILKSIINIVKEY